MRRGLTLIELMIAMAILFILIAMMATIYTRSSNVAISSLALLQLYHKQEAINRVIEQDLEGLLPSGTVVIEPDAALTLLGARRRDPTQDGTFFTLEPWRGADIRWVRYAWDPYTGILSRGESRAPTSTHAMREDSWSLRNDLSQNGIHPTGQRHARYLVGAGAVDPGPGIAGAPGSRVAIHDGIADVTSGTGGTSPRRFVGPDAERELRVTAMVGDTRPVAGVHAVVNPDGRSLNKDWANLVGGGADDGYPDQVAPMAERVELFSLELRARDGRLLGAADDADSLGDGVATIDLAGLRLDQRADPALADRPARAVIRYLLHDVPPKDVGSDGVTPLIEELRSRVLADPALVDPDPVRTGELQRAALRDLIIEWKRHAIVVTKTVRLPL